MAKQTKNPGSDEPPNWVKLNILSHRLEEMSSDILACQALLVGVCEALDLNVAEILAQWERHQAKAGGVQIDSRLSTVPTIVLPDGSKH